MMKRSLVLLFLFAVLPSAGLEDLSAEEIAISYPGLSGESSTLWVAREAGALPSPLRCWYWSEG